MRFTRIPILKSLIAGLCVVVLGLFSMGLLGGLLYYAGYPVLYPLFGDINRWSGDDVWPAAIGSGMLWSLAFPLAGWANLKLGKRGAGPLVRRFSYIAVLWLGAIAVWIAMAASLNINFG